MATRSVFTEYLGRGYLILECIRTREPTFASNSLRNTQTVVGTPGEGG